MDLIEHGLCVFALRSVCGLKGSRKPLLVPAVIKRRSTPSLFISSVNPKPSISTPMLPTMLALST